MIGDKTIYDIERDLIANFKKELRDQGHYLTGGLEQSIAPKRLKEPGRPVLEIYADDYVDPVNTGVVSGNIPYDSSRRTGAKTSKYIEGLKSYAKIRFGLSDEEALGAAFAIAKTQEKEGMPTRASYVHSSNKRRTQAIEESYNDNQQHYESIIENGLSVEIDLFIDKTFDQTIF
jgi:hypothetical protein